jgi:PKD repeat protein
MVSARLLADPVVPSFTKVQAPATGVAPATVTFTNTSTGAPTVFSWNFGDATPVSALQNPTHAYATAGNFIASLTASNAGGSGTASQLVSTFAVPVSSFTRAVGGTPLTINFTDTSTGNVTGWLWDFGDGTPTVPSTSTLKSPTHVYAAGGVFTVSLRTFNPAGNAVSSQTFVVGAPPQPTGLAGVIVPDGDPVTPGNQLGVTLTWSNVTGETGFRLEHSANATFTPVAHSHDLGLDVVTFTDTTVAVGETVFWRVFALNGAAASPPSNTVSVALAAPPVPTGVVATPASSTQIDLT